MMAAANTDLVTVGTANESIAALCDTLDHLTSQLTKQAKITDVPVNTDEPSGPDDKVQRTTDSTNDSSSPVAAASTRDEKEFLIPTESMESLVSPPEMSRYQNAERAELTHPDAESISCWKRYTNFTKFLTNSSWILLVYLLLLTLTCMSFYLGVVYSGKCQYKSSDIPVLSVSLGVTSIVAFLSRFGFEVSRKYSCRTLSEFFVMTGLLASMIYVVNLLVAVFTLNDTSALPKATPGADYCDVAFYNSISWNTWTQLSILMVLVVMYLPSCEIPIGSNWHLFESTAEV